MFLSIKQITFSMQIDLNTVKHLAIPREYGKVISPVFWSFSSTIWIKILLFFF